VFQTWTLHLFNFVLHAVYATVAEMHLPLLESWSCETRCHSVAALFVEIKIFEVLYALNFVCEKSYMQIVS